MSAAWSAPSSAICFAVGIGGRGTSKSAVPSTEPSTGCRQLKGVCPIDSHL